MIKLMYDVAPLGIWKSFFKISEDTDKICMAVCSERSVITKGINHFIESLECADRILCFVVGNDEASINKLESSFHSIQSTGLTMIGFLRYQLPKALVCVTKDQLPTIIESFDQYQSVELYTYNESDFANVIALAGTIDISNGQSRFILAKHSKVSIEKSCDDELEIVMAKKNAKSVLDAFICAYESKSMY